MIQLTFLALCGYTVLLALRFNTEVGSMFALQVRQRLCVLYVGLFPHCLLLCDDLYQWCIFDLSALITPHRKVL